jgi:hypothetical protein
MVLSSQCLKSNFGAAEGSQDHCGRVHSSAASLWGVMQKGSAPDHTTVRVTQYLATMITSSKPKGRGILKKGTGEGKYNSSIYHKKGRIVFKLLI